MRILIAEEDHASRLLIRKAVEKLGHECVVAEDGTLAWELFQQVRPDLVIGDYSLPPSGGIDLCRNIRMHEGPSYTYFMMLLDFPEKQHAGQALQSGADDYLLKPLDRDELEARFVAAARVMALQHQVRDQKRELERMSTQLFEDSRRDPLTRIGNRVRMQEDLEALAGRAVRYGHQFCIAFCDIDYFKAYNDTCGVAAGDETLKAIARTLARYSRSGDMAYRYGGEEFLVVLPEQSLEGGIIAMERRRRAVERLSIPHPGKDPQGNVTISAGIALFDPRESSPIDAAIRRAERALALAKQTGRNRVATHRQVEESERAAQRERTQAT
ncbi:MAG: diguanylate cyclase [Deltaproteobacteria bacterium]|nr:diguanylate cyclase [Deltaproteobacteria bacterium]